MNLIWIQLIKNFLSIKNVRLAKEGEFTKRAFLNNKMDLLEAEGVIDLINAETETQKKLAMQQMEGNLSKIFNNWSKRLFKMLAYYEAQIDFLEEEVPKNISDKNNVAHIHWDKSNIFVFYQMEKHDEGTREFLKILSKILLRNRTRMNWLDFIKNTSKHDKFHHFWWHFIRNKNNKSAPKWHTLSLNWNAWVLEVNARKKLQTFTKISFIWMIFYA